MAEALLELDKSDSATVDVPVVLSVMVKSPPESVTTSLKPKVVFIASAVLYKPASVVDVADVIVGLVHVLADVRELQGLPNIIFVLVHLVQELLHVLARLQLDVVLGASLFDEPNIMQSLISCYELTQAFSMFLRAF